MALWGDMTRSYDDLLGALLDNGGWWLLLSVRRLPCCHVVQGQGPVVAPPAAPVLMAWLGRHWTAVGLSTAVAPCRTACALDHRRHRCSSAQKPPRLCPTSEPHLPGMHPPPHKAEPEASNHPPTRPPTHPPVHADVNVMVVSGDDDFVCNSLGTTRWVDALIWSRQAGWARCAGGRAPLGLLRWCPVARCRHVGGVLAVGRPLVRPPIPPPARPPLRSVKPASWNGGTFRRLGPLAFVRVNRAGQTTAPAAVSEHQLAAAPANTCTHALPVVGACRLPVPGFTLWLPCPLSPPPALQATWSRWTSPR